MKRSLVAIKKTLAEYLQGLLDNYRSLDISWRCHYCHDGHGGNLLKKVSAVNAGETLGNLKTDITLLGAGGCYFAVIQLSTRQSVDPVALAYCRENNIIYLQILLEPADDLDSLKVKLATPNFVGTCYNPTCKECGSYQQTAVMTIIDSECYKCKGGMKIAVIQAGLSRGATCVGPESFTPEELQTAREKGVKIDLVFRKTRQEQYLANICPGCNAFTGQFYLFQDHLSPASMGYYPYETKMAGYYCESCTEAQWQH